jgi:hypothetical protein
MSNTKAVYRYIDEASREKFCESQCLLTISVGQEVHEGDKFESTIQLVSETFKSCIMLVDDTLQRHTMALNISQSAEELYQYSLGEGDRWLVRNEKYYSKLQNLNKIMRWDSWLYHADYEQKQNLIKNELENDLEYKNIFELTIKEFLDRYCSRLDGSLFFNYERGYKLCFDYLFEECTAMALWPELQCHYEVYPSRRNFAMDATHKRFVLSKNPDLLHAVAIKFKNRKQLKPQQFQLPGIDYTHIQEVILMG